MRSYGPFWFSHPMKMKRRAMKYKSENVLLTTKIEQLNEQITNQALLVQSLRDEIMDLHIRLEYARCEADLRASPNEDKFLLECHPRCEMTLEEQQVWIHEHLDPDQARLYDQDAEATKLFFKYHCQDMYKEECTNQPVVQRDNTIKYWKELRTLMGQLQEQIDTVDAKGSARMYLLENIKQDVIALQQRIEELSNLIKSCMLWPRYPPVEET